MEAGRRPGQGAEGQSGQIDPPKKALICAILRCFWAFFANIFHSPKTLKVFLAISRLVMPDCLARRNGD